MRNSILISIFLSMLLAAAVSAGVPTEISYQGRLTDAGGNPVADDNYWLAFTIYDAAVDGNSKWTESQNVTTTGGLFSVSLGAVNPILDSVFNGTTRYLSIGVAGAPELIPRTALVSVPFAFQASKADSSKTSETSIVADSTDAITDGGVDFADIGQNSATSGQVMKWNGSAWMPAADDGGVASGWSDDGTVVRLDAIDDSVGIGTANPAEKLHIATGRLLLGNPIYQKNTLHPGDIIFDNGSAVDLPGLKFYYGDNQNFGIDLFDDGGGALRFVQNLDEGGGQTRMIIKEGGNIGIGTLTPSERLDVVGNIIVSGTATIGSGHTNTGANAFVAGTNNTASGNYATISGGASNTADMAYSTIGGGWSNHSDGNYSTVAGGQNDTAYGDHSSIGGGRGNMAVGDLSFIGGGEFNTSVQDWTTVGGGRANTADDDYATVAGGRSNIADSAYSTVGGGWTNRANGSLSTISGGQNNTASGFYATVGGGINNTASYTSATIGGGDNNLADSMAATVAGGYNNTASGESSTISGGGGNTTSASRATISGGYNNTASNTYATVGGGWSNTASGDVSTIAGGWADTASGYGSTVSGGYHNIADSNYATVGGGELNLASGVNSTVSGGRSNSATGFTVTIGGGSNNSADSANSTVGGGESNSASGHYATVSGGYYNIANYLYATVGGGFFNLASNTYATVSGGAYDTASGFRSTVSGGERNKATYHYTSVGGGKFNTASSSYSVVAGGHNNTASGQYSAVVGGGSNLAGGSHSFAAGKRAKATHHGSFVWGDSYDGDVISTTNDEFTARASGGVRFFSNSGLTTGVTLAGGGGAWASVSDSTVKENIRPVDGDDILEKISALEITRWNYETQDASIEHIGPMAQDFYRLFGVGDNNTTITTIDPDGIALAAIKALIEKSEKLESEVAELRKIVQELVANQD